MVKLRTSLVSKDWDCRHGLPQLAWTQFSGCFLRKKKVKQSLRQSGGSGVFLKFSLIPSLERHRQFEKYKTERLDLRAQGLVTVFIEHLSSTVLLFPVSFFFLTHENFPQEKVRWPHLYTHTIYTHTIGICEKCENAKLNLSLGSKKVYWGSNHKDCLGNRKQQLGSKVLVFYKIVGKVQATLINLIN